MKLLEAQPKGAPGTEPSPPGQAPAQPGARACQVCAAKLEPGQDWCLRCGAAARPLNDRPGLRAALTMLGLTLVLVAGAVIASYAALRDHGSAPAAPAAASNEVAQAPPGVTTVQPQPTTPSPGATTPPATGDELPTVSVPSATTTTPTPTTAAPRTTRSSPKASTTRTTSPRSTTTSTPTASTPAPVPTPAPAPAPAPAPSTSSGTNTTTPKRTAPAPMDLTAEAASIYDPYHRAVAAGVPGQALDGNPRTAWFVDPPPGAVQEGIGFALDLGRRRGIRAIDIRTSTPGFRIEIYASTDAKPPPTIVDSRWAHISNKDIVKRGKSHLLISGGTSKYRTLLLWLTKPPTGGLRVRISELTIFG